MEDGQNVTFFTFQGFVDVGVYRHVYFVVLLSVYVLIVCFNVTILCIIWVQRNLHEPMYTFISALLLNSVLHSTNIYPKLLVDVLSQRQLVSFPACLLQFFLYYSVSAAEFLLLSAMAYDRYVSICRPLRYPSVMTRSRVRVLLVLTWLVSAGHVAVNVSLLAESPLCGLGINGIFCNNVIYSLQCVESRAIAVFGLVALLDLILLPVLFILFTYAKILLVAYRSGGDVRSKAAETCLPHLLVLTSFFCLSIYDISAARVEWNLSKTARFVMTLQIVLYHPLFNPLIYGLKMKQISKHLKRLLLC